MIEILCSMEHGSVDNVQIVVKSVKFEAFLLVQPIVQRPKSTYFQNLLFV